MWGEQTFKFWCPDYPHNWFCQFVEEGRYRTKAIKKIFFIKVFLSLLPICPSLSWNFGQAWMLKLSSGFLCIPDCRQVFYEGVYVYAK